MRNLLPRSLIGPHRNLQFWISNIAGDDFRYIGYESAPMPINANDDQAPYFVEWTADGSRIAYEYRGKCYSVAAR